MNGTGVRIVYNGLSPNGCDAEWKSTEYKDERNEAREQHNDHKRRYVNVEIKCSQSNAIYYMTGFSEVKLSSKIWILIGILDVLLLLVTPWIMLLTFWGSSSRVLDNKNVLNSRQNTVYLPTITTMNQTKPSNCSPAFLDNFQFDKTVAMPFAGYELKGITFVHEKTYFVIIRQRKKDYNDIYKVVNDKFSFFIKSSSVRTPTQIEYHKLHRVLYVIFYDDFSKQVVAKMSLNGTIVQIYEFKSSWIFCLIEGPHGKAFVATSKGVMELSSRKYLFTYGVSKDSTNGVYLKNYRIFVMGHYWQDCIVSYYANGSIAWTLERKMKLLWASSKQLTLTPWVNEVLFLDYYNKAILSIDHTGKVTSTYNLLLLPYDFSAKALFPILASLNDDVMIIVLRNGDVIRLQRKKPYAR